MGFRIQGNRDANGFINVTFDVSELLWWVLRVTLKDNLVVVTVLDQLAKFEPLVDVEWLRLRELGQALLMVWVEGASVDEKALREDVLTQPVLWNHTFDGVVQDKLRFPLQHMLHRRRFQVTNVARVLPVDFLLLLAPSHELVLSINDYTEVAMFTSVSSDIVWLILTTQEISCHTCNAT